jgi:hypothetical protein
VIAAPYGDPINPARTDAGITRVVFGGPSRINPMTFQTANGDFIGTTGDESLTGTSSANQIVAGDGNDTLMGGGGADVLYGGRGNDTIVIDASNITALGTNTGNTAQAIARIDGGNGVDTLEFTGVLDLKAISNVAMQSIERFNMTGTGASLKMGVMDVLTLSEKNNPFNTATGWTASATGGPANWGAVNTGAQVVVDGTTTSELVLGGAWANVGTVQNNGKTYTVLEDTTKAMAQVLVEGSVKLKLSPSILTTANELADGLLATEANSNGGTPVAISLASTGAVAGNTLQLNWGGQTISYTLTAADIAAGTANVPVPLATLTAVTAMGTSANVTASVTLMDGATTVSAGDPQSIPVNFIVATAPTISLTAWAATGTGSTSDLTGVSEAKYWMNSTAMAVPSGARVDNILYNSEVFDNGTVVRVQLPTTGTVPPIVGDTLLLSWGTTTPISVTLTSSHITTKYVDFTVPVAT